MKKKWITIAFFGVLLLIFATDLVFGHSSHPSKEAIKPKPKAVVVTKKVAKPKAEKKTDPIKDTKLAVENLYRDSIPSIGQGPEYPADKTIALKQQLLQYAQDGDYTDLINTGDKVTQSNKFSKGDNLDISGVLYDASIMSDLSTNNEQDMQKFGAAVAGSKTPEMLVLNTLYSGIFARDYIIKDTQSLSPQGYTKVVMNNRRIFHSSDDAKNEPTFNGRNIVNDIFTLDNNANEVYAFDILIPELHNLPLTAYVEEDLYGKLTLYGFYAPDDFKTYEQTVQWYEAQQKLFDNAKKEQEQNNAGNAKNGVITNDQMNKFMQSGQ